LPGIKAATKTFVGQGKNAEGRRMMVGFVDILSRRAAGGWATDIENVNCPVQVKIFVNGNEHCTVIADVERLDLAKAGRYGDGRHGFHFRFDPPLSPTESQSISVRYADTDEALPRGEQIFAPIADVAPSATVRPITPIVVTAMGRSGTTILMRKLADHSNIVASEQYPFEMKLISYYAQALRVMTAPADHERSSHPDRLTTDRHFVGSNPFSHEKYEKAFKNPDSFERFFTSTVSTQLAECFRNLVFRFYNSLAEDQGKNAPTFFAEKIDTLDTTRSMARTLFPDIKEIVLVRDLRDTYCSFRSFWSVKPEDAIRSIKSSSLRMVKIDSSKDANVMVVKYEDLIREEQRVLSGVSEFLKLATPMSPQGAELSMFKSHGTSTSPSESIGRWQRELATEEIELCNREFKNYQATFGYDKVE
jgi:hypothetical protein